MVSMLPHAECITEIHTVEIESYTTLFRKRTKYKWRIYWKDSGSFCAWEFGRAKTHQEAERKANRKIDKHVESLTRRRQEEQQREQQTVRYTR